LKSNSVEYEVVDKNISPWGMTTTTIDFWREEYIFSRILHIMIVKIKG